MAHHQAAVRQPVEEAREQRREIRPLAEVIGTGERRVGGQAERRRAAAEPVAQNVEHQPLAVAEPLRERQHAPALAQPGIGRRVLDHTEQRLAHLREQVHVLMPVNEIGRAAKELDEGVKLAHDLGRERVAREAMQAGFGERLAEREKGAILERHLVVRAHGPERRGQRQVQPDRHPRHVRVEHVERNRFRAVGRSRDHHHRGSVEPSAHDQVADRGVDRGRDAVVVGAQPDVPARGCLDRRRAQAAIALGKHHQTSRRRNDAIAGAVLLHAAEPGEGMVIGLHWHLLRHQHVVDAPPRRRGLDRILIEPALPVGMAGEHDRVVVARRPAPARGRCRRLPRKRCGRCCGRACRPR